MCCGWLWADPVWTTWDQCCWVWSYQLLLNEQQCYYGGQVRVLSLIMFMLHRLSELTRSCTFVPVTVQCIRDGQFVVVVSRDVTLPRTESGFSSSTGWKWPTLRSCGVHTFLCYIPVPCDHMWHENDGEHLHLVLFCFVGIQSIISCISIPRKDSGYVVYENQMTSSYESRDRTVWFHHKGQSFWVSDLLLGVNVKLW